MANISNELMVQALAMVRAMEPYKSGNLRWNATYGRNLGNGSFEIVVDGNVAPYAEELDRIHYEGLFTAEIPVAIQMLVDSTAQGRDETALASTEQIADTVKNNPARVEQFNKSLRKSNGAGGGL